MFNLEDLQLTRAISLIWIFQHYTGYANLGSVYTHENIQFVGDYTTYAFSITPLKYENNRTDITW